MLTNYLGCAIIRLGAGAAYTAPLPCPRGWWAAFTFCLVIHMDLLACPACSWLGTRMQWYKFASGFVLRASLERLRPHNVRGVSGSREFNPHASYFRNNLYFKSQNHATPVCFGVRRGKHHYFSLSRISWALMPSDISCCKTFSSSTFLASSAWAAS